MINHVKFISNFQMITFSNFFDIKRKDQNFSEVSSSFTNKMNCKEFVESIDCNSSVFSSLK